MLDVQLFGLDPGPHHLVNVLFHSVNTVLLFLLLSRMTGADWQSVFVAALLRAPSPPRRICRMGGGAQKGRPERIFLTVTLLLYALVNAQMAGTTRDTSLTLCSFALGLMAKPMLVTSPIVLR